VPGAAEAAPYGGGLQWPPRQLQWPGAPPLPQFSSSTMAAPALLSQMGGRPPSPQSQSAATSVSLQLEQLRQEQQRRQMASRLRPFGDDPDAPPSSYARFANPVDLEREREMALAGAFSWGHHEQHQQARLPSSMSGSRHQSHYSSRPPERRRPPLDGPPKEKKPRTEAQQNRLRDATGKYAKKPVETDAQKHLGTKPPGARHDEAMQARAWPERKRRAALASGAWQQQDPEQNDAEVYTLAEAQGAQAEASPDSRRAKRLRPQAIGEWRGGGRKASFETRQPMMLPPPVAATLSVAAVCGDTPPAGARWSRGATPARPGTS